MAGETYTNDCIVLKKTKLGESDLILTFLNASGARCQAIAKGARKPQSAHSSYLELGNIVHILFARGKKLDIITDVRLIEAHQSLSAEPFRFAAASCILEMACKISEENLDQPRFFEMTRTAIATCEHLDDASLIYLVSAFFLKACAMSGLCPSFAKCASCGTPRSRSPARYEGFSFVDGGVLCEHCSHELVHTSIQGGILLASHALLSSRFEDIPALALEPEHTKRTLDLACSWVSAHLSTRIKSTDLLNLSC